MKQISLKLLVAVMTTLSLCSCETIASWFVTKPDVSLDHVSLKSADIAGATVLFGVLVKNPNNFPLKVDAVQYTAEVGGHPVSSGTLDQIASVPANDKAVIEIPVAVKYADVFTSLLDLVSKQTSTYHVSGTATFGFLSVPFDQSGELKLK